MKKVLLVEDDKDFRETLQEWLQYKGFKVSTAINGFEAKKQMKKFSPDVLITDIIMPDMDGVELLVSLYEESSRFPCKVVAMSGGGRLRGSEYLEIVDALDVDAKLTKPFKLGELEVVLNGLFD